MKNKLIILIILIIFSGIFFTLFFTVKETESLSLSNYKIMGNVDYSGNTLGNGEGYTDWSPNQCLDICKYYSSSENCVGIVTDQKDLDTIGTCWFKSQMTTSLTPEIFKPRYSYSLIEDDTNITPWWWN